jgi:hypothetical protein
MKVYNYQFATATVLNTNINFAPLEINQLYGYAIQAVITGTPTGVFKLQCSADPNSHNSANGAYSGAATAPTNWTDIASSSFTVTASGTCAWNVTSGMYNWVRMVYTDSSSGSSTATVAATFNGKGV